MQQIGDQHTADLPEGTDTVIESPANLGAIETDGVGDSPGDDTGTLAIDASAGRSGGGPRSSGGGGIAERLRTGREQIAGQAGEKARGLVSQGLERTAEALANVSKMVGDTASGIEERLGPDYGDYARRAAGAIENVANNIADKDADELIDDTRNFVRNSPGIALAGAAVVGFVVARLVKSGLAATRDGEDDED